MSRTRRNAQSKKNTAEESDSDHESKQMEEISNASSSSEKLSTYGDSDDSNSDAFETFPHIQPVTTQSEVQSTRALITQQRQEIALLKAQCQEQKRIQAAIQDELQAAKRILFEKKAVIAPITRVPPEILGIIFTIHVRENDESPWILMQVSRAWRAAALITKSVWGRILIAPSSWVEAKTGGKEVRFYNGMEVCRKESQLSRALKRAGAIPLDLMIVFAYDRSFHSIKKIRDQQFDVNRLIDVVLSHQPNAKPRSLNVVNRFYSLIAASQTLESFNYANLVSLTLEEDWPPLVEKIIKEARRLRSLHVSAQTLKKMGECIWWSDLEELGIHNIYAVRDIKDILSKPKALKSLRLSDGAPMLGDDNLAAPIAIPSLSCLKLRSLFDFWPIECTNITHLAITRPRRKPTLEAGSIRLPNLIELSFESDNPESPMISVFDVPSLRKFDFQSNSGKGTCANVFKTIWPISITNGAINAPVSNIEPRTFSLRDTLINQKVLARTFSGRMKLEEVTMVDVEISGEFFENLLPLPKGGKRSQSKQIGCPGLKRLEIDFSTCNKYRPNQDVVETSAKTFISARQKAGAKMERLAIRFTKDGGWKELVDVEVDET